MKVSKEVAAVGAVIVLALTAIVLTREEPPPALPSEQKAPPPTLSVQYHVEDPHNGLAFVSVALEGAPKAVIRYKPLRGKRRQVIRRWTNKDHARLLEKLSAVSFFDVDEVPRRTYHQETPTVTINVQLGDREHELRTDGRTRASANIDELLAFLDAIRLSATPETILSGD